jgi:hypothetical protein
VQVEYYDTNGKLYRRFAVKKVRNIDGIPTPMKTLLEDLNTGSTTTLNCLEVDYGRGLQQGLFSEISLRQPPMKWLEIK